MRLRSDGQAIPVSLTISPIKDEAGRIIGASKIARDITDRKQAEGANVRPAAELKEADRRKDEFLATLAHELRNPLAPLRNALLESCSVATGNGDLIEQARVHDGAAVGPDGAAGGRPARREPHHPRQAGTPQGAGRTGGGRAPVPSKPAAR